MSQKTADPNHERLINWARWWNGFDSNGSSNGGCASVERRYVAPRPDDEAPRRSSGPGIDVRDALWIEAGVKALHQERDRKLLRLLYLQHFDVGLIARKSKLSLIDFHSWKESVIEMTCVNADRLRDHEIRLIRRGRRIWAGVAISKEDVYKSTHIVASVEQTTRWVREIPGPSVSEEKEESLA